MKFVSLIFQFGAFLCFATFFANLARGAAGYAAFLSENKEILMLLSSATLFCLGLLTGEVKHFDGDDDH